MNLTAQHTQVLIVGAGPSGLMMAAQLLRFGVRPVIIDNRRGPTERSKAITVQARSMEIYRQMGLIDEVLAGGRPADKIQYHIHDKVVAQLSLREAGKKLTPYPYFFLYPQSKNERTLLGRLTANSLPVFWQTTLTSVTQNGTNANATVIHNNIPVKVTADYIIGADGAHSLVRKQLGIQFKGDTYSHLFYLADIVADKSDGRINMYLNKKGFAGYFPMPEKNAYRVIGSLPKWLKSKRDIVFEDILPLPGQINDAPTVVTKLTWFTTYKLSHRIAEKFSLGRCFLIGDAAHIHSPVGGQGMNTGLQDAYNLAWKLGGVITGKLYPKILTSYPDERIPVAKSLLKTTDSAFNVVMSQNWATRLFKRFVLPKAIAIIWNSPKLSSVFFKQVSQINIHYRNSCINLHLSQATHIKAGDRLPFLTLYDDKKQINTNLHAWCSKPGFTMIVMGNLSKLELLSFARFITRFYGAGLNFFYLPVSEKNQHIFDSFEIGNGHIKTLVVRPDNYIGCMCDGTDIDIINNYLHNTAGLIRQAIN